ncbi:hypothetical protein K7432_008116 [Basidiobolus ranarum]|uniref:RecQ-mediated genome instability protein 1 n=1 Tax=Basidiobolus ranarum TaxID=34480 RepID=A0ABR2WSC7_9FUNG
MLKFTLTDGNQVTFAMEYRSLNNVDLFLPLGSKVLVNNVKVLRGVLLLEAQKFSVLGGQVEVLNQQSLIQRLRKRLNLEEENEESTNNLQSNNNNQNQPRTQGINEFASPQSVNFSGTTAYRSANSTATNLINSTSHSTIQNNGLPSRSQAFMPTSTSDNFDFDSDIEYQDQMLDSLLEQESFLFDSIPPDFVEEPSPPPSIEQHIREAPFPSFNPQSSHSRAKIPTIAVDDNEDSDEFDSMEFFQLHGDIDDTPIVLDSPKFTPVSAVTKSQQSHIDLTQKPRLKNEHLETNYGAATPDVIDLCDDDSFLLDESVQDMLAVAERLTSLRELENVKRSGVNSTYVKATINKFGKFSFDGQLFSVILTIKDTDNDDTEVILSNELVQKFLSHTPEEFKALTVPERRAEFQKVSSLLYNLIGIFLPNTIIVP